MPLWVAGQDFFVLWGCSCAIGEEAHATPTSCTLQELSCAHGVGDPYGARVFVAAPDELIEWAAHAGATDVHEAADYDTAGACIVREVCRSLW